MIKVSKLLEAGSADGFIKVLEMSFERTKEFRVKKISGNKIWINAGGKNFVLEAKEV